MIDKSITDYFSNAQEIEGILRLKYLKESLGNKKNPFNELLFILLSSKTPPIRYKAIYKSLKMNYPNANSLAVASCEDVAGVIKEAGLQNRKAKAIIAIAKELKCKFGRVTLAPLKSMNDNQAELFLSSLPEVNIKTARCILLYSLDRKVFPVDSHCLRICKRVGWVSIDDNLSLEVADRIQRGIPPELRKSLHIGMVYLGREFCLPQFPKCNYCPINKHCKYFCDKYRNY